MYRLHRSINNGKEKNHSLSRLALKQYSFLIYGETLKLCLKGHCNEAFTIKRQTLFASFKEHKKIKGNTFTASRR